MNNGLGNNKVRQRGKVLLLKINGRRVSQVWGYILKYYLYYLLECFLVYVIEEVPGSPGMFGQSFTYVSIARFRLVSHL